MENVRELLIEGAKKMGIELSQESVDRFVLYGTELVEYNNKINLTAITEPKEIVVKHFLDSISPVAQGFIKEGDSVCDVGSGAGFPGLPIKIVFPNIKLTLIDSLNKRVDFMTMICEKMGIEDVELVHERAEESGQNPKYREKFDVCLSRAVANMCTLSELCLPHVKVGGTFLALKGPYGKDETKEAMPAILKLGGKLDKIYNIDLPHSDFSHNIVRVKKVSSTISTYPRKAPKPAKTPMK